MEHVIKNEFLSATVSEQGAELTSLKTAAGTELLWQSPSNSFWSKHSPLLFPICGRLKDKKYTYRGKEYAMGAHGFISTESFTVVENTGDRIVLSAKQNEKTLEAYPFSFTFTAEYALYGDEIRCTVTVKNDSDEEMPYMFGWHPAFKIFTNGCDIEDYSIDFGGFEQIGWVKLINGPFASKSAVPFTLTDGKYRLCEKQIYDIDTMIFTDIAPRVKFSCENNGYLLEASWSENLPYLCVWKEPNHEAKFICLEPWSAVPSDGIEDECFETRRMQRLGVGKSEVYSLNLKFTV